jgi:ABC-2 type transport system ATP-binding protein
MSGWVIRTEGLCKRYRGARDRAVDSLCLTIDRSSIHGILGPNGAGKTTTLSMLCGLVAPDEGRIELADDIRDGARSVLGLVPQDLALYGGLTARENLAFFGSLYGLRGEKAGDRIDGLLEMVGLEDRADDLVRTYSTGMKRRLNLAAGLVHSPSIILLDEPTVGIDPQSRLRIFESVLELRRAGVTILYTTHYMEEASRLCDVVSIMDRGRVLLEGVPAELVREHGLVRMEFESGEPGGDPVPGIEHIEHVSAASWRDGVLAVQIGSHADAIKVIDDIGRASSARGVALSLRSIVEPSLETIFLDLTGRDLKDEGGAR